MPGNSSLKKIKAEVKNSQNEPWPGIGRMWFGFVFLVLFLLVSFLPNWTTLVNELVKLRLFGDYYLASLVANNKFMFSIVQLILWNFMLAAVAAPLFYLRIINIRLGSKWILALIVPFVWSMLLVRCLVYQARYTARGSLDDQGVINLKYTTYAIYVTMVLATTYFLADIL